MRADNLREHTERAERLHLITLPVRAQLLVISVALAIALSTPAAFADDVSMDATAGDSVGTSYKIGDSVALLGIVGNNNTLLEMVNRSTADFPGAPVDVLTTPATNAAGGWLHYTLHGLNSHKITVELTSLPEIPSDYWEFSVTISSFHPGGSERGTLYDGNDLFPEFGGGESHPNAASMNSPQDLITGIDGSDTWTGTESGYGARLHYYMLFELNSGLEEDFNTSVDVLYTLVAE